MSAVRWLTGGLAVLLAALLTWTVPGPPTTQALQPLDGGTALSAGPRPALPWRPGLPQLGVQVYWVDDPADTPDVVRRKAARVFDHVVGMEANAVSISFPFFTPTITANTVTADARTPSPERLAVVVDEAHGNGLRVSLRPLLDEANLIAADPRDWRGRLAPTDRDAWYASYQAFLLPYLEMSAIHHVQTVVLGAELNALQDDPHWAALVAAARTVYPGELGYAANWDAFSAATAVPVDVVGIDAYPQLDVAATATEAEMTAAWSTWLTATVPPGLSTPLYEVGAAAEAQTVANPAVPHRDGAALDEGVQARWLGAACEAARGHGLAGLYWWKIELDVEPAAADPVGDLHDSFLGRAAEERMRACFTAWSGT